MEQYLALKPEGEYVYDACDVLDAIEVIEKDKEKEAAALTKVEKQHEEIPSIRDVLTADDDDEKYGIKSLEKMMEKERKLFFLRNLLSIKYYLRQEYDKAREQAELVIKEDAANIHAHCNQIMIAAAQNDDETLKKEIEKIKKHRTENMNELNRIALTLLEYSSPQDALPVLKHMYTKAPYEHTVIHKLAICCYAMDDYKRSIELYDLITKIDETDDVAVYYRNVCNTAMKTGNKRGGLVLDYEVPMDEVVSRISRIKSFIQLSFDEQLEMWKNDSATVRLLIWGVRSRDMGVKRAMLTLISTFNDKRAELVLRDFLLREDEPDELKREVFALLAHMHAKEPFVAYIGGDLIESHVDMVEFMNKVPKPYRDVLSMCIEKMEANYSSSALFAAINIWKRYIEAHKDNFTTINKNQVTALSVALEYSAAKVTGVDVSRYELCAKEQISPARFEHAYAKIEPYITEEVSGEEE